MSKKMKFYIKIGVYQLLIIFLVKTFLYYEIGLRPVRIAVILLLGLVAFRYLVFRKEIDYLMNDSFYNFNQAQTTLPLPRLTPDKVAFYKKTGLTEEEVKFFRQQLAKTKQHIYSIEQAVKKQSKLSAIDRRYATIRMMKDYFKEIASSPLQLTRVGDFLYHYVPTLDELCKKYIEINNHVTKSHKTYETLEKTATAIEEICQSIERDYIEFQKRDILDAEIEIETIHEKEKTIVPQVTDNELQPNPNKQDDV